MKSGSLFAVRNSNLMILGVDFGEIMFGNSHLAMIRWRLHRAVKDFCY